MFTKLSSLLLLNDVVTAETISIPFKTKIDYDLSILGLY